ncbi:MAG: hypothetical protein KAR62_05130 [Sphingomonadales bacterium]|nr:hypothetical protein [Sphingomonadales bacterium]
MAFIISILSIKILFTLLFVAYPFLWKPKEVLNKVMGLEISKPYFYRLYGVAILALLLAYAYGIFMALGGVYPWGIVLMGMVSNGGAVVVLHKYSEWKKQKTSAIFFGGVFVALLVSAIIQVN